MEDVVDVRVQPLGVDRHRGCSPGVDVAGDLNAELVVIDLDFGFGLAAGIRTRRRSVPTCPLSSPRILEIALSEARGFPES